MRLVLPAAVLTVGLLVNTTASYGTQEYAKKEKGPCALCHMRIESKEKMAKNLNEAGNYYRTHGYKFDGYRPKK